ncbi:MAG: DUF72 domain-containing protein [Flavobacterium sp.]|nr:MAG: DUF72 domain-containing protein [Flavobacterium sp.]
MKKEDLHIGCSSFYNGYWKGVFYPKYLTRKEWFPYYCEHFNTYELNATFYKFPTLKSLQDWYDKSPEGFQFAVKAPKVITHQKKFADCQQEMDDFYEVCKEGFKEKLGCILFQLPPSFHYTPERLAMIVATLKPDFKNVIEFRNKTWWNDEVYEVFSKNNITFCSVSYPNLPNDIIQTNEIGYVRFHGVPKLFYSSYNDEELKQVADFLFSNAEFKKTFVYFNNTASVAGILNAIELKKNAHLLQH